MPTLTPFNVTVQHIPFRCEVLIRWDADLQRISRAVYDDLADTLQAAHGAEALTMGRYQVVIAIAEHVVARRTFIAELLPVLAEELLELGRRGYVATITWAEPE